MINFHPTDRYQRTLCGVAHVDQTHSHSTASHSQRMFGLVSAHPTQSHKLIRAEVLRDRTVLSPVSPNKQTQALDHANQPGRIMIALKAIGSYETMRNCGNCQSANEPMSQLAYLI